MNALLSTLGSISSRKGSGAQRSLPDPRDYSGRRANWQPRRKRTAPVSTVLPKALKKMLATHPVNNLTVAASAGNDAEIRSMILNGAQVNTYNLDPSWPRTPLEAAIDSGHVDTVRTVSQSRRLCQ